MPKKVAELARSEAVAESELVPTAVTLGELSGLFKPLREIMKMSDTEDRLGALLDQLDVIKAKALSRQRTIKNGIVIEDPDCNAAVRCIEVAARLLGLEKAPTMPKGSGIAVAALFPAQNEDQ